MKHLFTKFIAGFAAVCMLLPALTVPVSAAEKKEKEIIPSNRTMDWLTGEIDRAYEDDGNKIPALAAVIFKGNEIKYQNTFGFSDIKANIHADENTVFEWGSTSKTLIWVSAMQLWEQGRLDLEKDIRAYLPEGFFQHLQYDDPITMLNLMNHSGGWCETTYSFGTNDASKIRSLKQVLQDCEPAQSFRPGEVSSYSNWGAALAAYVIECIVGQDFCEYVHEHIFEPLGMEHTALAPDHSDNPWVAEQRKKLQCYQFSLTSRALGSCNTYIEAYPAGAATGTVSDLAKYAMSFVDDSAPLFAHPETLQKMLSGSLFYGDSDIPSMSYGFMTAEFNVRTLGHGGNTLGCSTELEFDPISKYGCVLMTNEFAADNHWITEGLFGEMPDNRFAELSTCGKIGFSGKYLPTRSQHEGLFQCFSYFNAMDAEQIGNVYDIGGNVCQSPDKNIFEVKTNSDGRRCIGLNALSYIESKDYTLKMTLFALYFFTILFSVFALMTKRKLISADRLHQSMSDRIISAGQFAAIASVLLIMATSASSRLYGVPRLIGIANGVGQMICIAAMGAALLAAVLGTIRQQKKLRYLLAAVGNLFAASAIIAFHMYQFWEC